MSEPVVFDSFVGSFQAALGLAGTPVLMLSPFGYEELCGRTFWTRLADALARAGMPSLRFDFPGTANALDVPPNGLEDWRQAAMTAAASLRVRTGRQRIAVLGQGLGATLALHWANDLDPLNAAVLIEPTVTGRAYLRGLKAWGASIAAASGVPPEAAAHSHTVAGFPLPDSRAAAIRMLDLAQIATPLAADVMVLEQPGSSAGKTLQGQLGDNCTQVIRQAFQGYADLVTDPTTARVPVKTVATIVDWLTTRCSEPEAEVGAPGAPASAPGEGLLRGDGFVERPIRFGPTQGLAGILCRPEGVNAAESAVVLVNAGRDHSIGWARSAVLQARALAQHGVASLRFDIGGVGDSRAHAEAPDEILYSARMCDDVGAAIDTLDGLGFRSLGLVGRCSGAWASFTVAVDDPRIHRLVLINTGYFLWDSSKTLAAVIRFAQRSVGDLGATLLRRDGLQRLLTGKLDVRGGWRFLVRAANRHLLRRNAPLLGRLTAESRRYHDLHALFGRLEARNVSMLLAYSEGDASLDELRSFMGPRFARLGRYPGVSMYIVAGADHNLTPHHASSALLARMTSFLGNGSTSINGAIGPRAAPTPIPTRTSPSFWSLAASK